MPGFWEQDEIIQPRQAPSQPTSGRWWEGDEIITPRGGGQTKPGYLEDIGKAIPSKFAQGVAGVVGLPGSAKALFDAGMDQTVGRLLNYVSTGKWEVPKVYEGGPKVGIGDIATPENVRHGIESVTGKLYEPQTRPGKYVGAVAEMLPSMAITPGTLASRAAQAVGSGLLSEGAGQVAEGTSLETAARVAGALAGAPLGNALLGPAAGAIGRKITGAPNVTAPLDDLSPGARKYAVETMGDPADLARQRAELQKLGPEAMLADVSPEWMMTARGAATRPGSRGLVVDALKARDEAKNARLGSDLDAALGPGRSAIQATQDIRAARSAEHRVLPEVFEGAPDVDTSKVLAEIGRRLNTAEGPEKSALERIRDMLMHEKEVPVMTPGTPPPSAGTVRFYHGGDDPSSGGSRWLTPDAEYARNFGSGNKDVHYVDIPKGHPVEVAARNWDEILDAALHPKMKTYGNVQAPEDVARLLRRYEESKPVMGAGPATRNAPSAPVRTSSPVELRDFIKRNGGINDVGGDLAAMGLQKLHNPKGMTLDEARLKAAEQGYLGGNIDEAMSGTFTNDLLDALASERPVHSVFDLNDQAAKIAAQYKSGNNGWTRGEPVPLTEMQKVPKTQAENIHNIKTAIDTLINYGDNSLGIAPGALAAEQGSIKHIRNLLNESMRDQVPGYARAMDISSELAGRATALDRGTGIFAPTHENHPAIVEQYLAKLTPEQRKAMGTGARAELERIAGTNANDPIALNRAVRGDGDWARENMRSVFGSGADDALAAIDREVRFRNTHNRVTGGSDTAAARGFQDFLDRAEKIGPGVLPDRTVFGTIVNGASRIGAALVQSMGKERANRFASELARAAISQGIKRDEFLAALEAAGVKRTLAERVLPIAVRSSIVTGDGASGR